jgi:hypothetical protein
MNRKIILLNVALLIAVGYAGVSLRKEVRAAKAKERKMLAGTAKITPPAPLGSLPVQAPVTATGYKDVAMKTLFHPSRNPDLPPPVVVVEAPPPPPPMPPLPKYHGSMSIFGTGQQALLSVGNMPTQPVNIGETIGDFKLVDVNTVDISFDYKGMIVRRTLAQLLDQTVITASAGTGSDGARTAAPPPPPVVKQPMGPQGDPTPFGFKTCAPNESLPDGTVQGGFRKVTYQTPFGAACRWDPVGR